MRLSYNDLKADIEYEIKERVQIPFLNAEGLLRTKQTYRSDDVEDRMYLEELLGKQSGEPIQQGNPVKGIMWLFWKMLTKWFR
jgi:hypothetical protein